MVARRHPVSVSDTTAPSASTAGNNSVRGSGRCRSWQTSQTNVASTMTTPSDAQSHHVAERVGEAVPHEPGHGAVRERGDVALLAPVRDVPPRVRDRGERGHRERDAPPPAHERDQRDHAEHGDAQARAGHADREQERRDAVTPAERTAFREEQQRPETEGERRDELHLPHVGEVLEAGPRDRDDRHDPQRQPRIDRRSDHHVPQQHDDREVHDDEEQDVGPVLAHAEHRVERTEDEDRHRRPVLVVRLEQPELAGPGAHPAVEEDEPVVAAEPQLRVADDQPGARHHDEHPEAELGAAGRGTRPSPRTPP